MSDIEWTLRKVSLSQLKDFTSNPRRMATHDADNLEESIKKFGECVPIVVNVDMTIVGGHQRVKILKKIGRKQTLAYFPDRMLNEKEIRELNLRLNRNMGEWDYDILANDFEIEELLNSGFSLEELSIPNIEISDDEEKNIDDYTITIKLTNQDHYDIVKKHLKIMVKDFPGAKLKFRNDE